MGVKTPAAVGSFDFVCEIVRLEDIKKRSKTNLIVKLEEEGSARRRESGIFYAE